jgi:hypothetical protein
MNLITFSAGQVQNLNFPTPALDKLLSYTNNTFSAQLLAPLTHHTSTTLHHKLASKLTKRE